MVQPHDKHTPTQKRRRGDTNTTGIIRSVGVPFVVNINSTRGLVRSKARQWVRRLHRSSYCRRDGYPQKQLIVGSATHQRKITPPYLRFTAALLAMTIIPPRTYIFFCHDLAIRGAIFLERASVRNQNNDNQRVSDDSTM